MNKSIILIGVMILLVGCLPETESDECIIECESQFNCELTTFGLRLQCEGNIEPEDAMQHCRNECNP